MKAMESPPSNLWREGNLEKQFVLNVKGHHLWSHLQVQGKKEEILDSLTPETRDMFEKKASQKPIFFSKWLRNSILATPGLIREGKG